MDEVQNLIDEQAVRNLAAFYCDAVTQLDPELASSVYAEDGFVAIGDSVLRGRAAICEGMRRSFAAFQLLQLIEHGGVVEVDGETARARWSTIELTIKRGEKDLNVIFGRYEDLLVRSPIGWRFQQRNFTMGGRLQIETTKLQFNPGFFETFVPILALPN